MAEGTPVGLNDLVEAIEAQDMARVSAILAHQPPLAQARVAAEQGQDQSLLHSAIPPDGAVLTDTHVAILGMLLDAGPKPTRRDGEPIMVSVRH